MVISKPRSNGGVVTEGPARERTRAIDRRRRLVKFLSELPASELRNIDQYFALDAESKLVGAAGTEDELSQKLRSSPVPDPASAEIYKNPGRTVGSKIRKSGLGSQVPVYPELQSLSAWMDAVPERKVTYRNSCVAFKPGSGVVAQSQLGWRDLIKKIDKLKLNHSEVQLGFIED